MKTCARCHAPKPATGFRSARNRPDGLYNYCKDCQDVQSKLSYQKHREKRLLYARERLEIPGVLAQRRAWSKKDYAENRESHLRRAKEWARNNRERRRAYVRKWNSENREMVRAYQKRYKALRRQATEAPLTATAWRLIQTTFRNRCVYCGNAVTLEQDHVLALSRGGAHAVGNVVPACRHCNATKLNNEAPPFWWAR